MPNQVSSVDDTSELAHNALVSAVNTFIAANGYTVLNYDDTGDNYELIWKTPDVGDFSGFYCGMKTFDDEGSDYYNILIAGMTGYVAENDFESQPGYRSATVPAHNQQIDYWLSLSDRRLAMALKVGTPVYESFYLGGALPYATAGQFPYPIIVGGMASGQSAIRFSETTHTFPYRGNNARMGFRLNTGSYTNVLCHPYNISSIVTDIRDANSGYSLMPIHIYDSANVYGILDGVYYITGFNNVVENTLTINSETYVVIQDVSRTDFDDYYALRLDS